MDINGSVALVTGGTSGLGLATVHELTRGGARVVALDLPGAAADALPAGATLVTGDVTVPDEVQAAIATAQGLGALRLAVNCAGKGSSGRVLGRTGPLTLEEFALTVQVNLVGTFNVLRLAAAAMALLDPVDGERGVIVNTASVAAYDGSIGQIAYASSKAGVAGMTLPAARDLHHHLIRVMAIAPGPFETPMLTMLPDDKYQALTAQIPHPQRLGQPHEFASLVAHIASNPMLNGEVIRLDGAARMGFP
jgi:NAD(P)-dependent dehydrogenase (short-subunit alcohol dehydrogenase family)